MPSISYRRNKKTGTTYAYSVQSYWDKTLKAPRNKQTYLGKVDALTGQIIPSKRKQQPPPQPPPPAPAPLPLSEGQVTSRVAGPFLLLESITRLYGIDHLLQTCFSEDANLILSLVYYVVHKGGALSRCHPWSTACLHPFGEAITSQRVSELVRSLSEDRRQQFLSLWLAHITENDWLCYDITSVSSCSQHNEYTQFGYNRDGESLEQINLAMIFGQNSRLPAYYRRMPGNISDVATLKTTARSLKFLGAKTLDFVLDRGFYSASNIDALFALRHKFTIAIPTGIKWVESILEQHSDKIASPANYLTTGNEEALYAVTHLHKWGKGRRRTWLHIFYSAERAASDFDRFTRQLLAWRDEVLTGKPQEKHEEFYRRYLIIKESTQRGIKVEFNEAEIALRRKKHSGYFCILSNRIRNAAEALEVYRNKDVVEKCFDDLKNHLDMKRLRVHNAAAMDGRLFIQFLSLIYMSAIRNLAQTESKLKNMPAREVVEEMETLVRVKCEKSGGEIFTETSPMHRRIMNVFNIRV